MYKNEREWEDEGGSFRDDEEDEGYDDDFSWDESDPLTPDQEGGSEVEVEKELELV